MNRLPNLCAAILLAAVQTSWSHSREPVTTAAHEFATLQTALRQAHTANDEPAYAKSALAMYSFLHQSPDSTLQLAAAQSAAGDEANALLTVSEYARMGQTNEPILQSSRFVTLRQQSGYAAVALLMASNATQIAHATLAFELPAAGVPEDIDFDPITRHYYVTSVLDHTIMSFSRSGQSTVFAHPPDAGSLLALKVDVRRRWLWASAVTLGSGGSEMLIYSLASGKLLHRLPGPPHASLGDMALDAHGNALVSDGEQGGVYSIDVRTRAIRRLDAGDFISPQTPVVVGDGKRLLVPDYVRGLAVLNLATRQVHWISMRGGHALSGIDGLYLIAPHTVVATQNGTSPQRVIEFEFDSDFSRVESEFIIERATVTLGVPTHGVVVDHSFYYLANSGWEHLDEAGHLKPGEQMSVPLLMQVAI